MTESREKKIYSREQFEELRVASAKEMAADAQLVKDALDVKVRAGRYLWIHQTNWFGEPILQPPQDMFALADIIFRTRPRFVLEIGVAWGGSLLFYSTLMEVLGGERIIGVDIFVPDDLRRRIESFGRISDRITLLQGSSTADATLDEIKGIIGSARELLVVLDSSHMHEHVLKELRLYSPLVGRGYYLVCADTVIEYQPPQDYRERPWGHGNNPKTALDQFLKENDRFEIDKGLSDKLLISCMPGGYLRCVKD